MSKLRLSEKLKQLLGMKIELNRQETISVIQYERECSDIHGFQLNFGDLDSRTKDLLEAGSYSEIKNMIEYNNSLGYMSIKTGEALIELFNDKKYDLYIKTISSSALDSIFKEGIRCLGNVSSGFNTVPKDIKSISLNASVQTIPEIVPFFSVIKNASGLSQGTNQINGTLLIQIPKNIPKDEIFYYNESSNTFNIKPEFITGFVETSEDRKVKDIVYSNNQKTM